MCLSQLLLGHLHTQVFLHLSELLLGVSPHSVLLDTTLYMYVMKSGYGTRACVYEDNYINVSTNQEIQNCFHCINTSCKLCVQVILGLSGGECVCTSMQAMPVSGKCVPHFY